MASTSGIRASGCGSGEYAKKILLKDVASYGPWKAKLTSILDAEDCWDIVNGTEFEPVRLATVNDVDGVQENKPQVDARLAEIKDFRKRSKKAASLITQTIDDTIVMSLDVHGRDPVLMWNQLDEDYNNVTPAQKSAARKEFLMFQISEEESYLEIKLRYNELIRKIIVQRGVINEEDRLETLLTSLPEKYDHLKESYYAQPIAPGIDYIWDRMLDTEATEKRRAAQSGASGHSAEFYYQGRGRGGGSFRGRGRGSLGNRGSGRGENSRSENCFRCGEPDHWSRECPKKDSVCAWCGGVGHIERMSYSKINGAARGGKTGTRGRGSGNVGRGQGGGHGRYGEGTETQGHAEVLIGEVNMGEGDGDGEDKEWVCDSGADHHMTGDITLFDFIEDIPSDFHVKQIKGKVAVLQWGVVRLSTQKADGVKGEIEFHEVLYMPGMRVNIFSLQRIRRKGACSYTFAGVPQPGRVIPIYNRDGLQIATMQETIKARPTLVCGKRGTDGVEERMMEGKEDVMEGEVLGGKGISMELLHKRLGHTSQGGMERLVREQLVRGLEEGMKGEFGMCRGCKMGKSSEKVHPRKDPDFRAKEPLELIHTDISGPFAPMAVEGGGQYNLVIIDDFSRKSWTLPLKKKSDTKVSLKEWIAVHENEVGRKVKAMRSDNGGEYIDASLETWLKEHGISHQTIPARSPQSNGVAERLQLPKDSEALTRAVTGGTYRAMKSNPL